jgi:hypothetical protein
MARKVKITTVSDHTETITIADKTTLEAIFLDSEDDFVVIPTIDGGEYVFRKSNIIAVVKEPRRDRA